MKTILKTINLFMNFNLIQKNGVGVEVSVWSKEDQKFVHIDDLPKDKQIEVRFFGNTLDNLKNDVESNDDQSQ